MITIPDFIQEAILGGINVTVMRHALYGICFDMNLMAKSHMHIVQKNDKWYALMRYDEEFEVEDIDDLKRLAEHGKHGRDFISADWAEFLMTREELAKRRLAREALARLTPEEQAAIREYS
jgi:hypothetical protein